jgi:uncharacterized protein YdiU (UPF0061 family)
MHHNLAVPFTFDNSYARLGERFFQRIEPTPVEAPSLLASSPGLAELLGLDEAELRAPEGVEVLAGNRLPEGAEPLALAYAGHQFGHFVPQLGDGRAILLGEVVGRDGVRRDVQLKGAGRTRFSRGGDGRAALGPVLRELVVSEAMHALGVPTTRALAAVKTGELVMRDRPLEGAVLTRVAKSHLRVGTFQYFAARGQHDAVAELVTYALARHYPEASREHGPALALLDAVMAAQITLVSRWLAVGFVHGVMNTDNTSIAGETIDYGPCAFLDAYDPTRSFSSIDERGRYAFQNQPRIALFNLARLAETLVPLVDDDEERAVSTLTRRLEPFGARFEAAYTAELRGKLGLVTEHDDDGELARELLDRLAASEVDYTVFFRALCDVVEGAPDERVGELFADGASFEVWARRYRARLSREPLEASERAARMRLRNPAFIARNHRVEQMIAAASAGDLAPLERLVRVLARPFDEQPEHAELAEPPGDEQRAYKTFCGT